MVNNKDMILYPYQKGYIAETNIEESVVGDNSNYELILIVDRSGSMRSSYPVLMNKLIPHLLDLLKFPENKTTHFIAFEDFVEYRKFTKEDFQNCTEPARGAIEKMTDVFPVLEKIFVPENQKTPFRILTLSDGELVVREERKNVPILASEFYEKVKNKFRINSQAIRYFTSSAQPDTMALASILQLNTINEATLIDINYRDSYIESAEKVYGLFKNDGIDIDIKLKSNKKCIRKAPWVDEENEVELYFGKNIFWVDNYDEKTDFMIRINDEETKMNVRYGEKLTIANYPYILSTKISEFLNKLKILKLIDGINAKKEIELIIQHFKKFEDSLLKDPEVDDVILRDGKLSSRLVYLKKLINKRKGLISNQMDMIKNMNKLSQLNSQQKADFLRNVDNTKLGKGLARRALNDGEDLKQVVINEVKEISNHIDELKDIDGSKHPTSFYSISTTVDSLRELCDLYNNPIFKELEITDILKFFNIVGIACNGNVGDYPDPSLYLVNKIYPGCYISTADIATAEEYSRGNEHLKDPGTKEIINNCIPIFNDEKLYKFLKKYAPKLLELSAGIGMRRVLADIPLTLESTILSGVWKSIVTLKDVKSEININVFKDLCDTMKYVCGKKYDNIIEIVRNQLNDQNNKNALYINGYGLFQMLPVIYNCALDHKNLDANELKSIYRAIARFEIYKIVRTKIRKSDNKNDFINNTLCQLLGIDKEKNATKLPELFEKLEEPKFYDNYIINKDIVNDYKQWIGWIETIPYSYILFSKLFETNYIEDIKNLNYEFTKECFGINYDYDKFIAFNIVQSLVFKDKKERDDDNEKIMKIIDSNREEEVDNFLKEQTKKIYREEYNNRYSNQKKEEEEIIIAELIDELISCNDITTFKNLMKNGITKGYLNYKFLNEASNGFCDLKNKILDENLNVPLRFEKLFLMLVGKDKNDEIIWNNGNNIEFNVGDYKEFILKHKPSVWEEFRKVRKFHKYRDLPNRHGHSNSKPSFWAMGYISLEEFVKNSSKEKVKKYIEIHNNCCGTRYLNLKM